MMPRWWALSRGDLDTTVAQVGFNLAQMVIPVFLLIPVGIPGRVQRHAFVARLRLGFLIGSLGLVLLAARLAKREDRTDVTAHVYGNNVPAIIAYTLSIMLPGVSRNARRQSRLGRSARRRWFGLESSSSLRRHSLAFSADSFPLPPP